MLHGRLVAIGEVLVVRSIVIVYNISFIHGLLEVINKVVVL